MAEGENTTAPGADDRFQESSEALSQFVAHILNQLSLSAWLPSAALVLALTFIFQLGVVLDSKAKPESPDVAIGRAFSAMAKTNLGGAILLFAAVIILTTLTQAFVFGAIRLLEGYWGTSRAMEWIAKLRCAHFQKKVRGLREHYKELTNEAWGKAQVEIGRQRIDARSGDDAAVLVWTTDMLTYLGDHLQWGTSSVKLSRPDRIHALRIPWERYAPSELLRRRINLDKSLRDFPMELSHIQPTWLGNVLRAYEDLTKQERVETFIVKVRDRLPTGLRVVHDQHRNQLDLYCSMVFVAALITAFAAIRLSPNHWPYAIVGIAAGIVGMWLAYRAAIASARLYGLALVTIAERIQDQTKSATSEG